MRLEALALVGAIAGSSHGQRLLQRYPSPGSNSSLLAYNSSASSSSTSSSTSSSSSAAIPQYPAPPYTSQTYHFNPSPVGPGTAPPSVSIPLSTGYSSSTANATTLSNARLPAKCAGQTLNVLGASLDWWYERTIYNVVSTFSVSFNKNLSRTVWTLEPATTPFDITAALASPICTGIITWNTLYNQSLYDYECVTAPTPVAASTTLIQQTAYTTPNATTGYGYPPNVVVTPTPAAITIPGWTYSAGTPFVYFSKYEIMTKSLSTYENGSVACAAATQTYDMAEPFGFAYEGADVNGTQAVGAGVTGDVNPAFLGVVGVSSAAAGSWVAAPTVAVVVQDIVLENVVFAAARPGFAPRLTTETVLQTPSATLPSFNTPAPPPTTGNQLSPPPGFTGHIESTQTKLQTPSPPKKPTKPAAPPAQPTQNPPNPGQTGPKAPPAPPATTKKGGIGHAISIIFSAIRPTTTTNALSVLESALQTFKHNSPTAAAIVHGVSGGPENNGNPSNPAPVGPVAPGQKNGVGTGPNGSPVVVVGGTTFTGNQQTQFALSPGETLTPGGIAVFHGTTVSLAPGITAVVVNDHTFAAAVPTITPGPIIVDGAAFSPNAGGTYTIDGQVLTPGGVIVVHGTTISLEPGASKVVIDGHTSTLVGALAASATAAPVLTIGRETFTPVDGGPTYDIGGQTLTPGEQETVTVDGTTYIVSLSPGATVLKIETEGPGGKVTATMFETLLAGGATVTRTAAAGSTASSGGSASAAPASVNGAPSSSTLGSFGGLGGVCFAVGTFALAIWL